MGKSSANLNIIYLAGMALVAVGFILPMFTGLGITMNGFDFIDFNNFGTITSAALLIFLGALVGIAFCFISNSNSELIKLLALVASIAGGILIILLAGKNSVTKLIGKGFWNHATYGTYLVLAGWVAALIGWFKK